MPPTLTSPFFQAKNQATKRSSTSSTAKNRTAPKRNGSILSFFKKSDTPPKPTQPRITQYGVRSRNNQPAGPTRPGLDTDDTASELFFEDDASHSLAVDLKTEDSPLSGKRPELQDALWHSPPSCAEDTYEEGDRYNESLGAVKRRRTGSGAAEVDLAEGGSTLSAATTDDANKSPSEQAPRPTDTDSSSKSLTNRHGPFLDESDSEDGEELSPCTDTRVPKLEVASIKDRSASSPSTPNSGAHCLPATGVAHDEDSNSASCQVDDSLEKEVNGFSLSYSALKEHEIYPLASGDAGRVGGMGFSDEEAAVCPICLASLGGLTDTEASLHVNDCLDGNPTTTLAPTKDTEVAQQITNVSSGMKRSAIPRPGQKNPFTPDSTPSSTSAFTKIMSANEEDTAWGVAAANEEASRGKQAYDRTCPFYKILPGFSITVDAFKYGAVEGCKAYFLSHYHSDHYGGLTSSWSHGPIYCSKITANLIKQQIKVKPDMVVELEFEHRTEVPGTDGVSVTMITANHCPGSSLFLFEKRIGNGKGARFHRILHCGDFRASSTHLNHPLLRPDIKDPLTSQVVQQKIDVCYLDTTYLNPKYAFPFQQDVIDACAEMCAGLNDGRFDSFEIGKRQAASESMTPFLEKSRGSGRASAADQHDRGKLLVVIGTYSIGKERICLGVARAMNSKIYVSPNKKRICTCLEDEELSSLLTTDPLEAQVHMHSLMDMRSETLTEYLNSLNSRFSRVVGIRPTGWSYRPRGGTRTDNPTVPSVLHSEVWKPRFSLNDLVPQRGSTKDAAYFSVPYSEHSSFRELTMFCCALRISRIIPTVNVGSPKSRERMKFWIDKWEVERRKNGLYKIENGTTRW
ncbi:hypothetical protein FQN49_000077 [Arthroderma sp. PD_2]|nr:hypothetical protein FQN49_000077 [Arthroderma sp. PD_2]